MQQRHRALWRMLVRLATWGITTLLICNGVWFVIYLLLRESIGTRWSVVLWMHNVVACWGPVGVAACAVALLLKWRWRLTALQLPLLVVYAIWYGPQWMPINTIVGPPGYEVRVATYNVGVPASDSTDVMQVIEALDADVVGLHDIEVDAALISLLERVYPHTLLPSTTQQIGLVSRYPIMGQPIYYKRYLRAVLDVNEQAVTVLVFTTISPRHVWNPWAYDPVEDPPELALVLDALADETNPVIVLCDCNASDQSALYKALDAKLDDAFREAGWGLGLTFPAHISPQIPLPFPLVRLDYIWYGAGIEAYDAAVWGDSGSSDHRPVVAELSISS